MDSGTHYAVKDLGLAAQGRARIEFAEMQMPILLRIRKRFSKEKPLKGKAVSMALHVTKETAVLVRTLAAGGARVAITGCNPLSTQDDVAAALAREGTSVYAWKGESTAEYYANLNKVLDFKPDITIDDGCDLVIHAHTKRKELLPGIIGGTEETTTGVTRLKAMEREKALCYPVIAVNNAKTKHLFDNFLGTSQSTLDALMRTTNMLLAGKKIVLAGYGYCGSGLAARARGMGMIPIVTEVEPVKALKAAMDGYLVMPMLKAADEGDVFVTVTGNREVLTEAHFKRMKDGAVLANSGHFDVEIDVKALRRIARKSRRLSGSVEEFTLPSGKRLLLIGEGRLANLAAAEGHPSEVMSLSFANQALAAEHIAKNAGKLKPQVHEVPEEIDRAVAEMMLSTKGIRIDSLTPGQKRYLSGWREGT